MTGFLTSGRATRFLPEREAVRDQARLARNGNRSAGMAPGTDREVAQSAAGLLQSNAFRIVMAELVDSARTSFENSPLGGAGDDKRSIAHAQLLACNAIMEKLQAMADDAKIHDRIEAEQAEHE